MAATNSAAIVAALSTLYPALIERQVNDSEVLIHLTPYRVGGGKACDWTVQFTGTADGAAVSETQTRSQSDADSDIEVPATLPWAGYDKVSSVTGRAERVAQSTQFNPGSLLGPQTTLLGSRLVQAAIAMRRGVSKHLYSGQAGQTPGQIVGLATAIDGTAGGSYAGIAVDTYGEWASSEQSTALSGLSFADVRTKLLTPIYEACGEYPTFLLTTPTIFDALVALYGANAVPYITEVMLPQPTFEGQINPSRPVKKTLMAGTRGILIDGVPVLRDRRCTANTIYGLNTQYFWLEQLLGQRNEVTAMSVLEAIGPAVMGAANRLGPAVLEEIANLIRNPRSLVPTFHMLGKSGDQDTVQAVADLQLVVSRRNAHGKLTLTT